MCAFFFVLFFFGHVLNELVVFSLKCFCLFASYPLMCAVPQGDLLQSKLPARHQNKDGIINYN